MLSQKYGKIELGKLILDSKPQELYASKVETKTGYKPVKLAEIPKFDQLAQAVFQAGFVDTGKEITAGVEIRELPKEDLEKEPIFDVLK
jgi:hypothetical protein